MSEVEFSVASQRRRLRVAFGGISAWHVIEDANFPASRYPGRFTRRAWQRRALCGAMSACVVGGDVTAWTDEPLERERITCRRCIERLRRLEAKP